MKKILLYVSLVACTAVNSHAACDVCDISTPPPSCNENNDDEDADNMMDTPIYDDMPVEAPSEG